jgi:Arylsulfotransferase (ASST)
MLVLWCLPIALLALLALGAPAWAATEVAISPLNGTPDASPSSQISFLGVPANEITGVSVVGSRSGSHSGKLKAYVSSPGASFLPTHTFIQGERVTASALVGPKGHTSRVTSVFYVARFPSYDISTPTPIELSKSGLVQSFKSAPTLRPPVVAVTANSPAAEPGDVFLTPTHGYGQPGAMILDQQGNMVWFHPVPKGDTATDLQVQSYGGQPVLTFWEGKIGTSLGVGFGSDEIVSSSYKPIATVQAGNGYAADLHEFQLTPQGSAFVTAYTLVDANLSSAGGTSNGILQDAVLQEIDVPTGLVMFEWHAYGHVALEDSYATASSGPDRPWDFFHMNSYSPDPTGDGNFIVSSRNTWAAYEINHVTGAVMWRLGGKRSSFKMGPGTGTAWQHDVQWQPDHTLTIFDNGSTPKVHSESRAIRERIDWATKTVNLVDRYIAKISSGSQGDNQVLANGDTFVGWGEEPDLTEFSPTGQIVFDAHFPYPGQSYRAFRFPWSATPASRPSVAVTGATAYVSWNGATAVSSWRVLGGSSSSNLAPIATAAKGAFETAIAVPGPPADIAVQALGAEGQVLGTSATIKG